VTLHLRTHPRGHIKPCLPLPAERPPSGPDWLHEIKHDGFRIIARRDTNGVRLYTRNGYNFAGRFPQIVEAVSKLKVGSCLIDGEAIVVDKRGLSAFDLLRSWRHDHAAMLCAFDLIEVDGKDLRSGPIEERKLCWPKSCTRSVRLSSSTSTMTVTAQPSSSTPARWVARGLCQSDLAPPTAPGDRRIGSRLKIQKRPAVKREAEEDWGR